MRSISNSGSQPCRSDRSQDIHPERHHRHCTKKLYIVGIGPGNHEQLSQRARSVLGEVSCVVGYATYIDLIKPLIEGKKVITTGMTKEVDRVGAAIDMALSENACAIVSSGDPGIYAMAGLVFEMCMKRNIRLSSHPCKDKKQQSLGIEVVSGIPALSSCGSLLGAPLTHDFAVISLSDLLTPWERIEKRLEASAMADFVIVLYNPKSKKRKNHLETAQKIALKHRSGETPVGIVTAAFREKEQVVLTTLKDLHKETVTMQSTVFIGNSNTFSYEGWMVTPRGYSDKYDLKSEKDATRVTP